MRHILIAAAIISAAAADIAEARCWGANGYCTRAARHRREAAMQRDAEERRAEIARLSQHRHLTWEQRLADHQRLKELTQ